MTVLTRMYLASQKTEQTQIERLIRNYTVCLQEIIFEMESKWNKTPGSP